MKIAYLDASSVGKTSLAPLESLGDFVAYPESTHEQVLDRVKDCEVIIVNKIKITEEVLEAAKKLKLICESATGVNNIDLDACEKRDIIVRNVAGYSTNSVVQLTYSLMLSLLCNTPYYDNRVKSGIYSRGRLFTDVSKPFIEMSGKTIGIIGMGTIGRKVADVAISFGMNVVYYSTSGTSHCKDFPSLPIDELMTVSDIVSIHAPLNEKTQGLVGEKELALMKKTAIILNLGRGGIVDESALANALNENKILGAGLDVYENEPLDKDSPLLKVINPDKIRLMPHIGWASSESLDRLIAEVAKNIQKGF